MSLLPSSTFSLKLWTNELSSANLSTKTANTWMYRDRQFNLSTKTANSWMLRGTRTEREQKSQPEKLAYKFVRVVGLEPTRTGH